MEELVNKLKKMIPFKDTIDIGDIILVAGEPDLLLYALVIGIERDETRRDEWWHLKMQMLAFPPQEVTWTLRTEQMTGMEIFTMGGEERFIKAVEFVRTAPLPLPNSSGDNKGRRRVEFEVI